MPLQLRRAPDGYDRDDQSAFRAALEAADKDNLKRGQFPDVRMFSPTIAFGGAAVDVSYVANSGLIAVFGPVAFVQIGIALSAKGSSTGAATIAGLTVPTGNRITTQFLVYGSTLNLNVAGGYYQAAGFSFNSTSVGLYEIGDNVAPATLTDADFSDTTSINVFGMFAL